MKAGGNGLSIGSCCFSTASKSIATDRAHRLHFKYVHTHTHLDTNKKNVFLEITLTIVCS